MISFLSAMNPVHLFTYHPEIANFLPVGITVGLIILAALMFRIAMSCNRDSDAAFFLALVFVIAGFTIIRATQMKWHHRGNAKGAEIQVVVNGKDVWLPAHRLPNGVYWPINAKLHK